MNLKDLDKREIIIFTPGSVVGSTILDFDKKARDALSKINKNLQSDEDFIDAKSDSKICGLIETRIANAKQSALQKMTDYFEQATVADKLSDEIRSTRLLLDKLVKTEETRRKKEITDTGIATITERLKSSSVYHANKFYDADIISAIKNRRSLQAMQDAVNEVIARAFDEIKNLEGIYEFNMVGIDKAEKEYPGLFPDKRTVALCGVDEVAAIIEARIAKFRLAQKEKEEADVKRLAEEKAEAERLAEIERQVTQVEPESEVKLTEPPIYELPPDPFLEADIPPPPIFEEEGIQRKVITVQFVGGLAAALGVIDTISSIRGVMAVDWDYA